jgi:hypothetical protein
MKTSNNSVRTIAVIALSIVVATGCGEAPIDDVGSNAYLGQETGAQAQPAPQGDFNIPLEEARPSLDGVRIETAPAFEELPIGNGHVPDPGFDIIENVEDDIDTEQEVLEEEVVEEELEEVEEASIEDGFRDGDATAREWKDVAKATCRYDESELSAFTVIGERDESLYRGARFACMDDSDVSQGIIEGKYLAVVLGGESTCKSYDTFVEAARMACGSEAEITTKKVFNSCSQSGSERMYESALFVCQIF